MLQDVMCTGSEANLTACASGGLGFVDEECGDSSRAAGVICMRSKYHFDHISYKYYYARFHSETEDTNSVLHICMLILQL